MSVVTMPKVLNAQLQMLINNYITTQNVTKAVSKNRATVSFASKHLGHHNYGRKNRRYA